MGADPSDIKSKIQQSAILSETEKKEWIFLLPKMNDDQVKELERILSLKMPASPPAGQGGPASQKPPEVPNREYVAKQFVAPLQSISSSPQSVSESGIPVLSKVEGSNVEFSKKTDGTKIPNIQPSNSSPSVSPVKIPDISKRESMTKPFSEIYSSVITSEQSNVRPTADADKQMVFEAPTTKLAETDVRHSVIASQSKIESEAPLRGISRRGTIPERSPRPDLSSGIAMTTLSIEDLRKAISVYEFFDDLAARVILKIKNRETSTQEIIASFQQSPLYRAYVAAGKQMLEGLEPSALTRSEFEAVADFRTSLKKILASAQ